MYTVYLCTRLQLRRPPLRLISFLDLSFSKELKLSRKSNEDAYRAAFIAKDFREVYQILKHLCTQTSVVGASNELQAVLQNMNQSSPPDAIIIAARIQLAVIGIMTFSFAFVTRD